MQAPKQEIFMLNWEIFDLNKKLQTFANVYSVVDLWTVECLSQLIATIDAIMTRKSIKPYGDWDKKDEKIFRGYSFHHSINCKQCGRAVKIAKPSLLKHLKECGSTAEQCASNREFIEEVLEIALSLPRKTKPGNETKASMLSESFGPNRNRSSQSTSTVASQQNRPKQADSQKKLNDEQNVKAKNPLMNKPAADKLSKKPTRRSRSWKQKKATVTNPLQPSNSDSSVNSTVSSRQNSSHQQLKKTRRGRRKSNATVPNPVQASNSNSSVNSTVSSKQNDPKKVEEPKKLNEKNSQSDNAAQSSSTVVSNHVASLKQLNEHNCKKESSSTKKPKDDNLDITLHKTKSTESKQVENLKDKTSKPAPPKLPNGPKRKTHRPNRTVDGEYVTKGSIPNTKVELTKKTKQFIINVKPQTHLEAAAAFRKELTNSPAHDNIVQALEGLFKASYPKAKAYPFGSRITGLGKHTSDLDIYLDLQGNYDGSEKYSKDKLKWCVLLTEEYLKQSDQWDKLDPVTSARTPILRAWNTKEKIDCDISFTHGLSHSNTKLVQYLFDLQPVCYYVALYAKEWSRHFSINGLNTYTLVLLTIFYFQKNKLLPCIHSLQKSCKDPMFISHWQANIERKSLEVLQITQIPDTETEQHIRKFFSFYGFNFCFETRVVCPFLGWAPQKEDFDPLDCEIPLEMENLQKYYDQIDMKLAHPVNDLLSYMKPMVVQDPFELNHNVAKGISPADVNRFRKFCALTATLLYEVLNETD